MINVYDRYFILFTHLELAVKRCMEFVSVFLHMNKTNIAKSANWKVHTLYLLSHFDSTLTLCTFLKLQYDLSFVWQQKSQNCAECDRVQTNLKLFSQTYLSIPFILKLKFEQLFQIGPFVLVFVAYIGRRMPTCVLS